jgi:hypothetical protein
VEEELQSEYHKQKLVRTSYSTDVMKNHATRFLLIGANI